MCRGGVTVLKFGGSVLVDDAALRLAVHEVYRWRRAGEQVIAVVSAFAGATDELLVRCHRLDEAPSAETVADVLATGEQQSAALLGLHLDRAGVPARVLCPAALGLVAEGSPLDASPRRLDERALRRGLDEDGVVVVPGYAAIDDAGRTVVLGRGGSDLTALFLAGRARSWTRTRCRLIKDVDGLYDRDPAQPGRAPAQDGPPPRRFVTATWDDALATDGSIVQHKAVRFAQTHGISFELGRLNGTRPTRIGAGPTRLATDADTPRPLRVALLGLGTVGGGVLDLARQMPEAFEIVAVTVRDPEASRDVAVPPGLLTTDVDGHGADVVVETIGGIDDAQRAIESALVAGADVVTANKAVLAERGPRLDAVARASGRSLLASAAVGGSMPLLERIAAAGDGFRAVRAILNGTTNFVLDRVASGVDLAASVEEARDRGFAERDPSRDLLGLDAADKLAVIARTLPGGALPGGALPGGALPGGVLPGGVLDPTRIGRDALSPRSVADALASAGPDASVRHVASLHHHTETHAETPIAEVRLLALDAGDALARVPAEHNAAEIVHADGVVEIVRGKGAGRWPTAEAVVADLLDLARRAAENAAAEGGLARAG